jgi:cell division protein FtsA
LPAGVVLTGGCAELSDLAELARNVLQMPVRVGRPERINGLTEEISGPAFATSVGLLLWGLKNYDVVHADVKRSANGKEPGILNRIFSIFRVFLPASQ